MLPDIKLRNPLYHRHTNDETGHEFEIEINLNSTISLRGYGIPHQISVQGRIYVESFHAKIDMAEKIAWSKLVNQIYENILSAMPQ